MDMALPAARLVTSAPNRVGSSGSSGAALAGGRVETF